MPDSDDAPGMPPGTTRRTALITGGTRGIGFGIARALATDGWELVITGQRPAGAVTEPLEHLRQFGHRVEYVAADLSQSSGRSAIAALVHQTCGVPNALVNNAGRAPRVRADIIEATEDSFEEVLRTNLEGPYFLTQSIAREMLERRRGDAAFRAAIVFVTSVSAEMASPNRGEYCVSKAGLAMAAKLFAVRLAPAGIPVYDVRPGIIATDMTAGVKDAYDHRIAEGLVPEGRWGQPADVGRAVCALLRDDVPYATGTVIHVDGGLSIPRL